MWTVAVPTIWCAFFGIFTLAVFFSDRTYYGFVSATVLKIGIPLVLLAGLLLMLITIMRFKRIDIDADFLYATNYIKTYRYPWHNVKHIKIKKGLFFNKGVVSLKEGGQFGSSFTFLLSNRRWREFINEDIFGVSQYVEN
jgi:hypothetical protein